jgi:hypothetical protein
LPVGRIERQRPERAVGPGPYPSGPVRSLDSKHKQAEEYTRLDKVTWTPFFNGPFFFTHSLSSRWESPGLFGLPTGGESSVSFLCSAPFFSAWGDGAHHLSLEARIVWRGVGYV